MVRPRRVGVSAADGSRQGGSYRKIVHLPKDVKWTVIPYTDPEHPLARADEDELLGIDLPVEPVPAPAGRHAHLAVQVELTLGTATYATMALREVLKRETGTHAWKEMTKKMQDRLATAGTPGEHSMVH